MTHFIFKIAAVVATLSTSACISPAQGPEQFSRGPANTTVNVETGEVSLGNRIVSRDNDQTIRANGQSRVTRNADNSVLTARATDGQTFAVAAVTQSGEPNLGAAYGRSGDLNLPTSGQASFHGDYVGIITRNTAANGQSVSLIVDGDVGLLADFGTGRIGGSITNRRVSNRTGNLQNSLNSENVRMSAGTINENGTFNLTTAGGDINSQYGSGRTYTGSVAGILGGDDAGSVAGHVRINHNPAGVSTTYQENGSFVAN